MDTEEAQHGVGHNSGEKPKTAIDRADEVMAVGNKWLTERPVITDQEMADKAGGYLRQLRATTKMLDDERLENNKPFRASIAANDKIYNDKAALLAPIDRSLSVRLNKFFDDAKAKRDAAEKAAREEAEAIAAKAEEAKRKADALLEQANSGDAVGSFANVTAAVQESRELEQQQKQAEQDLRKVAKAPIKAGGEHFSGGVRRSLSQRTVETPVVENAALALRAVGTNDGINAELIKAARAYKKLKNKWPAGIRIDTSTKV